MKKVFTGIIQKITKIIYQLLETLSIDEGIHLPRENLERLSIAILFSLPGMVNFCPDEETENIRFMVNMITSIIYGTGINDELEAFL